MKTLADYIKTSSAEEQAFWYGAAMPFGRLIRTKFYWRMVLHRYVVGALPMAIAIISFAVGFALVLGH